MEFDVFEKLSELETAVHCLRREIEDKDAFIQFLVGRTQELESALGLKSSNENQTNLDEASEVCDLARLEDGKSIADVLKETWASCNTDYTFDENTGLYYDKRSGYYYDPKDQLFYEPNTSTYYSYNATTGEYTKELNVTSEKLEKLFKISSIYSIKEHGPSSPHSSRVRRRKADRMDEYVSSSGRHRRHRRSKRSSSRSTDMRRVRRKRRRDRSINSGESSNSSNHQRRTTTRARSPKSDRRRRIHHTVTDSSSRDSSNASSKHHRSKHEEEREFVERPASPVQTSYSGNPVRYPPSVRLTVLTSDYAVSGQVFVITNSETNRGWGCIGRSSSLCPSVNFPDDPAVSAIHSEVFYDEEEQRYSLIDRRSASGTYINGRQILKEPISMCHGDIIRIGTSRLLVHIHEGLETCGQCDSEALQGAIKAASLHAGKSEATDNATESVGGGTTATDSSGPTNLNDQRRAKLDELKTKFGLKDPGFSSSILQNTAYNDRAAKRRAIEANLKAAGYPLPAPPGVNKSRLIPKPNALITASQAASMSVPLSSENRGAKMLTKMGWNPGQGLGKNQTGIAVPVTVTKRVNPLAGLGSIDDSDNIKQNLPMDATREEILHAERLRITKKRYDMLEGL